MPRIPDCGGTISRISPDAGYRIMSALGRSGFNYVTARPADRLDRDRAAGKPVRRRGGGVLACRALGGHGDAGGPRRRHADIPPRDRRAGGIARPLTWPVISATLAPPPAGPARNGET